MKLLTIDKIDEACERYKKVQNSNKPKFVKLDTWLEKESNIFEQEINEKIQIFHKYKRGQIIKVDFGVNIGTEMSYTHFAIVLNDDDTKMTDNLTVVPLTSKNGYRRLDLGNIISKNFDINSKYKNNTYAYITQIKTISKKRVLLNDKKIICDNETLEKLDEEILKYLTKK